MQRIAERRCPANAVARACDQDDAAFQQIGARLIKPLLVVTSTGMALRLLWQAFG